MSLSIPFLYSGGAEGAAVALKRLVLKPGSASVSDYDTRGGYNESWLQNLIAANPAILPIGEIEPAFTPAISICTELPLVCGFLDNLLVTPKGDLIAVECKLWRNPQARREVIAQIIDYASALKNLGYCQLQDAIRIARKQASFDLYAYVAELSEQKDDLPDEPRFIDAVSRNLRHGRCLLIIAGDGIREEVESMTEFLQQHAGMNFTLALVQLAVHQVPGRSERLIIPSVPMRTKTITRGVVRIEAEGVTISPVIQIIGQTNRAATLSEDEFFGALDATRPDTSTRLKAFLTGLQDLGVEYEVKKTLIIRLRVADQSFLPFVVYTNGTVDTDYTPVKSLMEPFVQALTQAIPMTERLETPKTIIIAKRKSDGSPFTIWDVLDHQDGTRTALKIVRGVMEGVGEDSTRALDH